MFSQVAQLRKFSKKMQKDLKGQRIRHESFSDRIIFMSMFKKSIWTSKGTKTLALSIREKSKCMRQDSFTGKSVFRASPIVKEFDNSGNPVFNGVSLLGRGTLKMRSGRNTIHLSGEFYYIGFLFRTVHAANQLCFYGAVTMLCDKQPEADSGKKRQTRSARRTPREI